MTETGTPAGKASSDVTVIAIVTAIATALAAFQLFQPKFAIGIAMRRETGRAEPGFRFFYEIPQCIGVGIVFVVCCVVLLAFWHQVSPAHAPDYPWLHSVIDLLAADKFILLLLMVAVLAAFIQLNILSWIFLWVGRGMSMLPIPGLVGAFGPGGRSAGWHQAWCVCWTWDKGLPLLISQENVERLADVLLLRLAAVQQPGDFAEQPSNTSTAVIANLAVIGCMIEKAHTVNRWNRPTSWTSFYRSLERIHQKSQMFEPATLVRFKSGLAYSAELRKLLAAEMVAQGEVVPEGDYFAVGSSLAKAWEVLKSNGGSVLGMLPWYAGLIGSKLFWLDRRLSMFPLLDADSMRPQAIKLMARWGTTPWVKAKSFLHPFARNQGWLLFQEQALTVLPEQKDVTFWGVGDVPIVREACRRIYAHLAKTVQESMTAEAKTVATRYSTEWDLIAAADFMLWSLSREEIKRAEADEWKASKGWRWKFSNGRATKIS